MDYDIKTIVEFFLKTGLNHIIPEFKIKTIKIDNEIKRYYELIISIEDYSLILEPHQINLFKFDGKDKVRVDSTISDKWTYDTYVECRNKLLIGIEDKYKISIEEYSFNLISLN